jgi:hypothetical protein
MARTGLGEHNEPARQERLRRLAAKINDAWDDPGPSRPAAEAFDRIEKLHADAVAPSPKTGA